MTDRHYDNGCWLGSFRDLILVECPRCSSCARSAPLEGDRLPAIIRVSCLRCGYAKDQKQSGFRHRYSGGRERNSNRNLPLWLQRPCCGETLWAFNYKHLTYMASYVGADHRMRNPKKSRHFDNSSMVSRFPRWMISAKNRKAVLRGIQFLREKRDDSGR